MKTYITIWDDNNVIHYSKDSNRKQFEGTFKEWLEKNMPLYAWKRSAGSEELKKGFVEYTAKIDGGMLEHYLVAEYIEEA